MDTGPNPRRRRNDSAAPTPAAELTVTLWCVAVLLAVLLTAYWGIGEIYSN